MSARVAASYHDATVLATISANGKDADLSGPFGSFPAYTVLDQLNFNDAGETTVVVGAAYDFSHIITDGLKFQARYGKGWDVIDPQTGVPQSRQDETQPRDSSICRARAHSRTCMSSSSIRTCAFPTIRRDRRINRNTAAIVTYLVPLL